MAQLTSTMVTYNISSPGFSPHHSWNTSGLVPAVVMFICFLLGFPGNIAVIILKPNWENMSSLIQSLMLSLAVSDLLSLVTLPVWIYSFLYGWTFSLVGCKLITYFVYGSLYVSLVTITVLSVQRYLQVVYLQRSLNRVKASMLLVPLWLAAMILSTPALVVGQLSENQKQTTCSNQCSSEGQRMAVLLTETFVRSVSLSVIVFSYINLYRKVNRTAFFNNPQTTRLITSITVAFAVLWMPYLFMNVLNLVAIFLKNEHLLKFSHDIGDIGGALIFVNSALNPLLYAFTSNRLSSLCHRTAQLFTQKFRISQTMSTAPTTEEATQ